MREGAILSGLLHGVVILLLLVGLPELFRREIEPPAVIPIEVVNIADITQASATKAKPKEEAPKKEVKEEKPKPPTPQPVEEKLPEPDPKPEPMAETEPQMTMDDLLAIDDTPKEEAPKKKEKEEKKPKEKPKKKKNKPKKQDFTKLLNNIEKIETASSGKTQPEQDETATEDFAANNVSNVLSVTELDLVRRQIKECWNVPAGARDGKNFLVEVRVEMNPDATVRSAVVTKSSGNQTFDESALRAVRNPRCSPLKLPLDRYNHWKTIVFPFDPQYIL